MADSDEWLNLKQFRNTAEILETWERIKDAPCHILNKTGNAT